MSEKQFLDYEGLEHYHDKITGLIHGSDSVVAEKIKDLYGLSGDVTTDDVFNNIWYRLKMITINKALFVLTLKTSDGEPLSGLSVPGITDEDGSVMISDERGIITGFVSEGTKTLSLSGYADLTSFSKSYTFTKGLSYSDTWEIEPIYFLEITSTRSVKFSPRIKHIDYSVVGGGGGGGSGTGLSNDYGGIGGSGGGGGYCKNSSMVPVPNTSYSVTVGAGGNSGTNGGASSFSETTANGGGKGTTPSGSYAYGGSGNGAGGRGSNISSSGGPASGTVVKYTSTNGLNGEAGSIEYYSSLTETALCGGGGGGGGGYRSYESSYGLGSGSAKPGSGGSPNGGAGGTYSASSGSAGKGYGGGGGGGGANQRYSEVYSSETKDSHPGGSGYAGVVTLRMYTNEVVT